MTTNSKKLQSIQLFFLLALLSFLAYCNLLMFLAAQEEGYTKGSLEVLMEGFGI